MNFVDDNDAKAFVAGLDLSSVARLLQACAARAEIHAAHERFMAGIGERTDRHNVEAYEASVSYHGGD